MYISRLFQKNGEMLIFNKYRGIIIVKNSTCRGRCFFYVINREC